MGFWGGLILGWISMFFGLFCIAKLGKWAGRNKQESSVTIVEPDGTRKVTTKEREEQGWDGPENGADVGENSVENVGENVHAVLKRGQ